MKRVKWIVLLGVVVLLGACSKSPKEEFISAYDSLSSEEYNAGKFELSITDFQMNQTTGAAWASMLSESLKNMSVNGDYQYNAKDESFRFEADVKAFDNTMPIEMVGKGNEVYLSTSFIDGMLTFMDSFGRSAEVDQEQLNDLEGKYIAIDPEEMKAADDDKATLEPKEVRSKMNKLLGRAKEDSFKSEGETVSHTFSSKDLEEIAKSFDLGADTEESLHNMTLTMKINKKTLKTDCTVKMRDSEQKMTMKVVLTPSKKKTTISIPKEQDIVPAEELDDLFVPQAMSGVAGEVAQGEDEIEELSDEQFEVVYQQFEANMSELDETQRQALLSAYSPYLTDEQFARLEALLSQEVI
ncbi:hypothetical protein [Enterococcus sp. AZ072]|uniref:hypothetical protein n=1 Tax=unclassified Enterococcus TaxID=2608891 RepID=UPI003D270CB8